MQMLSPENRVREHHECAAAVPPYAMAPYTITTYTITTYTIAGSR